MSTDIADHRGAKDAQDVPSRKRYGEPRLDVEGAVDRHIGAALRGLSGRMDIALALALLGQIGQREHAEALELFERTTRRYRRPAWDIRTTSVDGREVAVRTRRIIAKPFCNLVYFERDLPPARRGKDSKVLIVAPMAGHYPTLLRGTVRDILPDHEVYVTEWRDARRVPRSAGFFDLDDYVVEALSAGARGFLLKHPTAEELVHAVHVIAAGNALLAPAVTKRLLDRYAHRLPPTTPGGSELLRSLTKREHEVLALVTRGRSNAAIGQELKLAESSVKTHVSHILNKLGLTDRIQLVVFAYENGLIQPGAI